VFEFNIRFIGGLLSSYALTKDPVLLQKADDFAAKLLPAFDTPTGIPYALINPSTGVVKNYGWASGGSSILSEAGSIHLEFVYLSHATGKSIYRDKVMRIRDFLDKTSKPNGLYPNYINPKNGLWGQRKFFPFVCLFSLPGHVCIYNKRGDERIEKCNSNSRLVFALLSFDKRSAHTRPLLPPAVCQSFPSSRPNIP
jgi:hypothetical protein